MDKSELIANLKENHRLHEKSGSTFKTVLFISCLLWGSATYFLELSSVFINIGGWVIVVIISWLCWNDNRIGKKIDTKTSMHCPICKKRYDEETMAYAVLINECQNCKTVIYDT